ncbi:MAG: TIGR03790 family protein [Alphaproteobacteria bacterium]|nr:TIGR03790 family protein [Alphaproteobacteria bacterium]
MLGPLLMALPALAGGGPANVLVVYNADDADATDVALHYRDARSIPAGQLCPLTGIDPADDAISAEDYALLVLDPVEGCLEGLPQPDDVDYLVLVRGLPYRVDITGGYSVSLDMALQVYRASPVIGSGQLAGSRQANSSGTWYASIDNPVLIASVGYEEDFDLSNAYMGWYVAASAVSRMTRLPDTFSRADAGIASGYSFDGNLFVVGRLDGFDYEDARALVDRAVAADGSYPTGTLLCMESADGARGARDPECELTTRLLADAGFDAEWLSPHDSALSGRTLAAYYTGAASIRDAIAGNTYAPGAMVDNLTSYGAVPQNFRCSEGGETCPASESQTSIARWVRAGATGVHGTVAEPLNNVFPNASALLLYTFGYNMGESWLFSTRFLYWQSTWLGDPLTTPWATRPTVSVPEVEIPEGEPLIVEAAHPDGIAELRLYVDGVRVEVASGDRMEAALGRVEGEVLEVLAVAVAEDVPVAREGWPAGEVSPAPAVQGWTTATVTVGPPLPQDTGTLDDTGGGTPPPTKGCACGGAPGGGAWPALLPLLVLGLRRRARTPKQDRLRPEVE